MGKPSPFRRKSIAVTDSAARKEWASVPAHEVLDGDLIRGKGLVVDVIRTEQGIQFEMKSGDIFETHPDQNVEAFVKVKRG